ncbi:hypothetical protein D3C74_369260 [compost metagenome]
MSWNSSTGEIIGRVIFRKILNRPAPSRLAASIRLAGTPCSPARKRIMPEPAVQKDMIIKAYNAVSGFISQAGPWMPNQESM